MTSEAVQSRARGIKVLIFDVDGVLTDGAITLIPSNNAHDSPAVEVKLSPVLIGFVSVLKPFQITVKVLMRADRQ